MCWENSGSGLSFVACSGCMCGCSCRSSACDQYGAVSYNSGFRRKIYSEPCIPICDPVLGTGGFFQKMDIEPSSLFVQVGIVLIIWGALYFHRKTTSRWVFVLVVLSTCLSILLVASGSLGLSHGDIDILSLLNVLLNMFILLAIGQSKKRHHSRN